MSNLFCLLVYVTLIMKYVKEVARSASTDVSGADIRWCGKLVVSSDPVCHCSVTQPFQPGTLCCPASLRLRHSAPSSVV